MSEATSPRDAPEDHPAELTRWISYLLRQVTLRAQQHVSASLQPLGLKPAHNTVLSLIDSEAKSQIALATRTGTDRSTMVNIVDDLEHLGLIERLQDPGDRRTHQITLTRDGRKKLKRAYRVVTKADTELLEPLSGKERELLRDFLQRMIAHHDRR
jgi:DNA-binding MarR family transcriptional regulator